MSDEAVFTDWQPQHTAMWGHAPLKMQHSLHRSPLLSMDALAELVENYPRQHYSLIHMGAQKERRLWREGDLGGVKGKDVLEWIATGRIWINLRRVDEVDSRYRDLIARAHDEMVSRSGTEPMFGTTMGILISSPKAQVYYHFDLLGQALWQIHGRKRVRLYPDRPPFLTPRMLEDVTVHGLEVDIPFEDWFDDYAQVFDIEPGDMLYWPLNAPHRVENFDVLNVSVTSEHNTNKIKQLQRVNMANGLLRERLGWEARSRRTSGPGFMAKTLMQAALRRTGWVDKKRSSLRPVEFKLDPVRPGGIIELNPAQT